MVRVLPLAAFLLLPTLLGGVASKQQISGIASSSSRDRTPVRSFFLAADAATSYFDRDFWLRRRRRGHHATPSILPPPTPPAATTVIDATAPTDTAGTKQQPSFKVKGWGEEQDSFVRNGGGWYYGASFARDGWGGDEQDSFARDG